MSDDVEGEPPCAGGGASEEDPPTAAGLGTGLIVASAVACCSTGAVVESVSIGVALSAAAVKVGEQK